MRYVLLLVS